MGGGQGGWARVSGPKGRSAHTGVGGLAAGLLDAHDLHLRKRGWHGRRCSGGGTSSHRTATDPEGRTGRPHCRPEPLGSPSLL